MPFVRWQSPVDFVVLVGAIYLLLSWAKKARAVRIALGIIGLYSGALVARNYDLPITSWILSAGGFLAIAVLLVVFQPELRHAFMRLDALIRTGWRKEIVLDTTYRAISEAAFALGAERVGALMVLVRRDAITELIQDGTPLGAQVSHELLQAIFQKTSPLHDGAVIIDGPVATRASAVLPLTQGTDIPPFFGTRHRAGMGLAERSDAAVIVVSEQRGTVTLMQDRKLHEMQSAGQLVRMLEHLESAKTPSWPVRLRYALTHQLRFKLAAVALAAALWAIALFASGTTVRTVAVPIEFTGVPAGMMITSQTASELTIQLRGNALFMDSSAVGRLVATFNLNRAKPGSHRLRVDAADFDLPFGVRFERATPAEVTVRLAPRTL
ncbi:MAG TPA: diadenylate cyclase [Bryobacteraceae bacterium]|nr:diadenylate cyclase [Bryobacteraceae bacterium]